MKDIDRGTMPMKAVYSYNFPEVRPIITAVNTLVDQDKLVRTQLDIKKAQDIIAPLFAIPLDLPATPEGKINLDELHRPITERIVKAYSPFVSGIEKYPAKYLTAGSSEGIFHVMAELKAQGKDSIYVLKGEYEGYKEFAKQLHINPIEIDLEKNNISQLPEGDCFISNPNARDGNILPEGLIDTLANYHRVHLDLAYVAGTLPHVFDASHPNIKTIFMSLSKPFGLFRWRIGYLLSREPLDSLYANKWFNGTFNHLLGLKIVEEIGLTRLPLKYRATQEAIVSKLGERFGFPLKPSDAILLAHMKTSEMSQSHESGINIETYRRDNNFRLCLTPFYEEKEDSSEL